MVRDPAISRASSRRVAAGTPLTEAAQSASRAGASASPMSVRRKGSKPSV